MNQTELPPHERRAIIAVAMQFFANGAMTASFIARAPQIRDQLGVDVDRFGLLLTVAASVGILGSLVAGRVVHRLGTKRVLQVGAVALISSLPVIGVARSPWVWLTGMFLYVFFDTLVDISMNLQGSWLSARRHTPIMNRLHGLWSVGTFAGGLGAVIANALTVSPFVHLCMVAGAMVMVLSLVTRSLLPRDEDQTPALPDDVTASALPDPRARDAPARDANRLLPVALLVLAGMFAVVLEITGGDWATFRLSDDFSATAAAASAAFVSYTTGMTLMRFAGDFLQIRWGSNALHHLSLAVATSGFALATLVPEPLVATVGFFLIGLGVATFMPKLYDDAARLVGRRGAGLGAMTAGMRVAYLVTPLCVGALAGTELSVGAALALYSLPAAILFAFVTRWSARLAAQAAQ